jgi:hypothetical protein
MPRNALSWNEQHRRLKDAKALAAFLDLAAEDYDIKEFRKDYPDFLPPAVWQDALEINNESNGELRPYTPWLKLQNQLKKVWDKGFPEKDVLKLISENSFFLDAANKTGSFDAYRKAILFLYDNSWRAKICLQCKCHFIAHHSQSECCSSPCAVERRTETKDDWYNRIKNNWNAKRRRDYAAKAKAKTKTRR